MIREELQQQIDLCQKAIDRDPENNKKYYESTITRNKRWLDEIGEAKVPVIKGDDSRSTIIYGI